MTSLVRIPCGTRTSGYGLLHGNVRHSGEDHGFEKVAIECSVTFLCEIFMQCAHRSGRQGQTSLAV